MNDQPSSTTDAPDDHDDVDEQFRSLLEGLRTSLPAVQVLFAFLLTAPLQGAFTGLNAPQQASFTVAFYSSGVASVLLVAPSVHQRVRAPMTGLKRESLRHLIWATWLGIVGSGFMAIAVAATVYLVSSVVYADAAAAAASGVVALLLAWSWFYLPIVTFRRTSR